MLIRQGGTQGFGRLWLHSFLLFQFPHANISLILAKLKGPASSHISMVKTAFLELDTEKKGKLSIEKFR